MGILTLVGPWLTMKLLCLLSSLFLLIIMIDLAQGCRPPGKGCDCCDMRGGCKICDPPKQGKKCNCKRGFFYCWGVAEDCSPGEECPANCKHISAVNVEEGTVGVIMEAGPQSR